METDPRVQQAVEERVERTADRRKQVLEDYAQGRWAELAPVEQTVRRLEHMQEFDLAQTVQAQAAGGVFESVTGPGDLGEIIFEQIIGHSEIMPVRFVHSGSRVARAVGRLALRTMRRPNGTGFLVSPRLLLTNFHVLRTVAEARSNVVQFDYLARADGSILPPVEFTLQPEVLFLQSPIEELDCTLVAVEPINETGSALSQFGWCRLIGRAGKEHPGERVNVVHHPGGNPKQVSLRENFLALILDRHLHYMTDTAPGSSGSPVFNDEWEVVALHHAAREIIDPDEVRAYHAALSDLPAGVEPAEPTVTVNEGARISQIVAWLGTEVAGVSGPGRELLEATLAESIAAPAPSLPVETGAPVPAGVPVTINIHVGSDSVPVVTGMEPPPGHAGGLATLELFKGEAERSVLRGLGYLQTRREDRYLPAASEVADRVDAYYQGIPARVDNGDLDDAELYDALHELISEDGTLTTATSFPERLEGLESIHRVALQSMGLESALMLEDARYDRARAHLYTWVDLHPDRMLRCVYTDALIAPEQLLLKDLLVSLDLRADLPRRLRNNQFLNCEHLVPQSWFHEEPIARADLHHLVTADGAANNFRSDSVYRDLAGVPAAEQGPSNLPPYIPPAGRKATDPKRFEPSRNKAMAARATLYFVVAHKGKIDVTRYGPDDVATLVAWAEGAPPSDYERHRNEAIFEVQGNRNPFIDFPDWVQRVDFGRGLAPAP